MSTSLLSALFFTFTFLINPAVEQTPVDTHTSLASALQGAAIADVKSDPDFQIFGDFTKCDSITVTNCSSDTHHFLIAFDCDGDGILDIIADEMFADPALEDGPRVETLKKFWWYPCEISHLIYVGPAGGGPFADVKQTGPCSIKIF